jgi:hypothetical protein
LRTFFYFYTMQNQTFLSQLANRITQDSFDNFLDLVIILPNKRSKVFLMEALKNQIPTTVFAPEIISIEEFVQDIAKIRSIDTIDLLFEFYKVYQSVIETSKQESFDSFANWAKVLLSDFNEIDRYLIDPNKVLKYLENIKEIEHWSLSEKKTDLIEKHLAFWRLLPTYYDALHIHLKEQKKGYQGLIYREADKNLESFIESTKEKSYIFAGFNALNKAEEKIIQKLLLEKKAKIYWDIDSLFLNDPYHDAGLFIRRVKKEWTYYTTNPFEWIFNDYKESKNIHLISIPKAIGQAKTVGSIIEKLHNESSLNLSKTAVVLGDENLLLPVLYSLPQQVSSLNITMGYKGENNPVQILVDKLFKMHNRAVNKDSKNYVFYYKDILDVLNHSLVEYYSSALSFVQTIKRNNFTYLTHKKVLELNISKTVFFDLLFYKWDGDAVAFLQNINSILLEIKSNLTLTSDEDKLSNAFIYSMLKLLNKLISYCEKNPVVDSLDLLYVIYKQLITEVEVSFEGEPLEGLQIMGVLESRVLDFETVIITSVNEGKFPAGKTSNSFIPFDVKRELGLPTYKEKDAIYTFHFYHLLQRAKNIYLLYNTEADGMDAGEKSRFITQLLIERQKNHSISEQTYNPFIPTISSQKKVIKKSKRVISRLQEMASKGFSPSSLITYIRNPLQFYFQQVLQIYEAEEVEESIENNTLGTIIHNVLEELYKPFVNSYLSVDTITNCISMVEEVVVAQFKLIYKEGEINKGYNLLALETTKRSIKNFLKSELSQIEKGDEVKILALEKECSRTINHPDLPFPVLLKGKVDRIELRNGVIRIIDYKTGAKVENAHVSLKTWDGLTKEIKSDKIIQILTYAFLYQSEIQENFIEAGIISFKNLKSGFLPFTFVEDKNKKSSIDSKIMNDFIQQLVLLLQEILDEKVSFVEKI